MANHNVLRLTLASAFLSLVSSSAFASEVTLRAVSGFTSATTFSAYFESFIQRVNDTGKGKIQIKYIGGGAKVMDPFQVGSALRSGVVDIAELPGAYYTNVLPEADALKMMPWANYKLKGTTLYGLLQQIHETKANMHDLARLYTHIPFHLFLTANVDRKHIEKMDLAGLKIRTTPIYAPFFKALGAADIRMGPGEVYTALDRGVVQGYGWPLRGVFDFGWDKLTKYRVDPGFYSAVDEVLVNQDKWKGLTAEQRAVLEEAATWAEKTSDAKDLDLNKQDDARQRKQGIEVIAYQGEQKSRYLKLAGDTAWQAIEKESPSDGAKLKQAVEAVPPSP